MVSYATLEDVNRRFNSIANRELGKLVRAREFYTEVFSCGAKDLPQVKYAVAEVIADLGEAPKLFAALEELISNASALGAEPATMNLLRTGAKELRIQCSYTVGVYSDLCRQIGIAEMAEVLRTL